MKDIIEQVCPNGRTRQLMKKENITIKDNILSNTEFLNTHYDNILLAQRVWHILNNDFQIHKCPICKINNLKWFDYNYARTCSLKCGQLHGVTKQNRKILNLKKYGVESHNQAAVVKLKKNNTVKKQNSKFKNNIVKKRRKTNLKKYGHINSAQSTEIQQKIKKTNMERYGCEHVLNATAAQQKVKETNLKKYGVKYPMESVVFRNKAKLTFMEKYKVDNPLKNEYIQKKCKISLMNKYNVYNSSQIHLSTDVVNKLNNKEWLIAENSTISMTAISKTLGVSDTAIFNRFKSFDISPKHFTLESSFSIEFENFLNSLSVKFIKNSRKIIPPLEIDFYLPKYNIGFELNGTYWHSELRGKGKYYHSNKTKRCAEKNIKLMHIFDHQWNNMKEIFKNKIISIVHQSKFLYNKKYNIHNVSLNEEKIFLNKHHLRGYAMSDVSMGLYLNNILQAIMTFTKEKLHNCQEWELLRFATVNQITIIGGGEKLLTKFKDIYNPKTIMLYIDKLYKLNDLYTELGFYKIDTTEPTCIYTKNYKNYYSGDEVDENTLSVFDDNLTKWENMKNNNYDRIWNCGNDVYIWKDAQ